MLPYCCYILLLLPPLLLLLLHTMHHQRCLLAVAGAPTAVPSDAALSGGASSSCPAVPELLFSRIGHTQQDLQTMMDMANARQVGGGRVVLLVVQGPACCMIPCFMIPFTH